MKELRKGNCTLANMRVSLASSEEWDSVVTATAKRIKFIGQYIDEDKLCFWRVLSYQHWKE